MRRVDSYIEKYGPLVGPKLYRTMQSRAAYKGVSTKLRKKIAEMKAAEKPVARSARRRRRRRPCCRLRGGGRPGGRSGDGVTRTQ